MKEGVKKISKEERAVQVRDPKLTPQERRQLLAEALEDSSTEGDIDPRMSKLEKRSIGKEQRQQYRKYLRLFRDYCKESGLTWLPTELDWTLADYFDVMFSDGAS